MSRKPNVKALSLHPRAVSAPRTIERESVDGPRRVVGTYILLRKSKHDQPRHGTCGHTINLWEVQEVDGHIMVHAEVDVACGRVLVVRCPEIDRFEMEQATRTVIQEYVAHLTGRHGWHKIDFPEQILARARGVGMSSAGHVDEDEDEDA